MMTFARACPSSTYAIAADVSASGYCLSITGVNFSAFDKFTKSRQIGFLDLRNEEIEFLPQEQGTRKCFENSGKHGGERLGRPGHDALPVRLQNAAHR